MPAKTALTGRSLGAAAAAILLPSLLGAGCSRPDRPPGVSALVLPAAPAASVRADAPAAAGGEPSAIPPSATPRRVPGAPRPRDGAGDAPVAKAVGAEDPGADAPAPEGAPDGNAPDGDDGPLPDRLRPVLERHDEGALRALWDEALPMLEKDLVGGLDAGDVKALYFLQLRTASALQWAALAGDAGLLRELAALHALAFPYATERERIGHYYVHRPGEGKPERIVEVAQPPGTRAWLGTAEGGGTRPEQVLDSGQFLYGVARLVRALAGAGEAVEAFDAEAWSLLTGHLARWILPGPDAAGAFQRTGWGCGWGDFGHAEHVENLLARRYGTGALPGVGRSPPRHCNVVTDVDLFVIAGAGEALLASALDPRRFPLEEGPRERLVAHVERGLQLVESRLAPTLIELPDGSRADGRVFDPGAFDAYRDMRYAGDADPAFPGWRAKGGEAAREPRPAEGLGWDLGHARRFALFADTARALADAGIVSSPIGEADLAGLGRQAVLGTWNGDAETPLFANYTDGSNGWYRVNYADRPGYGFGPYGFSRTVVQAGYGYWGCGERRVRELLLARAAADEIDPEPSLSLARVRLQRTASILLASCAGPPGGGGPSDR